MVIGVSVPGVLLHLGPPTAILKEPKLRAVPATKLIHRTLGSTYSISTRVIKYGILNSATMVAHVFDSGFMRVGYGLHPCGSYSFSCRETRLARISACASCQVSTPRLSI